MEKLLLNTFILLVLSFQCVLAQDQTVGVSVRENGATVGYTFFAPNDIETAYMVDDCGYVVNTWERNNRPGLGSYFLPNGLMLRTNKVSGASFSQASTGGLIELVDWDNNTVWSYTFSNEQYIQHHDVAMMPNGNILIPGWEKISTTEQLQLGRSSSIISNPDLWGEFIFEVKPIGSNNIDIVWEWHLKDHFIQDDNSNNPNFGNVSQNPQLVDINYQGPGAWDDDDWWHCNAIDYNESLDQILLNSRNNNELWIIDHSTTTAEAAGHTGGRSGHGGDLLFRWGNPEAYNLGSQSNLRMYGSHGQYWIEEGLPRAGQIMYFNNGDDRPEGYYSTIETLDLNPDSDGNYPKDSNGRFLPAEPNVVYKADDPFEFRSYYLSNAQQLANGNIFINEGGPGRLFEVNEDGDILWQYTNPASFFGNIEQGENPLYNDIFRAYKFTPDYPGLAGKDLTPQYRLEGDENGFCLVDTEELDQLNDIKIWYNPDQRSIHLTNPKLHHLKVSIYDLAGRLLEKLPSNSQLESTLSINTDIQGIILVRIENQDGHTKLEKIIAF